MLLSKDIRHIIFKTSDLMKRFDFTFDTNTDFVAEIEFLRTHGHSIQYLNLNYPYGSPKLMKFILNLIPNLNGLEFKNSEALNGLDEKIFEPLKLKDVDPPELSNLQYLVLEVVDYEEFYEIFKNAKNILRITYKLATDNVEDEFLDFLVQQDSLKELTMVGFYDDMYDIRDLSQEVKFQLRKLDIVSDCENFLKFLKTQAEHLEEFRHTKLNNEIFKILLENCKNLRKIFVTESCNFNIKWNDFIGYKLETVWFLQFFSTNSINLATIYEIFPNLKSLKCLKIAVEPISFEKLQTLNIESLYLDSIKNTKFPGLTNLTVKYLQGFYDNSNILYTEKEFNEENFTKFIENVPNLENLTVNLTENQKSTKCVFKHLRDFQNLQFAEINYQFFTSDKQHKIVIDFGEKTVTSEKVIYYVQDLQDNFEDYVFQSTDGKLDDMEK